MPAAATAAWLAKADADGQILSFWQAVAEQLAWDFPPVDFLHALYAQWMAEECPTGWTRNSSDDAQHCLLRRDVEMLRDVAEYRAAQSADDDRPADDDRRVSLIELSSELNE